MLMNIQSQFPAGDGSGRPSPDAWLGGVSWHPAWAIHLAMVFLIKMSYFGNFLMKFNRFGAPELIYNYTYIFFLVFSDI